LKGIEKRIRRGGQVFARRKKYLARKVAKAQRPPEVTPSDQNFFASLRLCAKKRKKIGLPVILRGWLPQSCGTGSKGLRK